MKNEQWLCKNLVWEKTFSSHSSLSGARINNSRHMFLLANFYTKISTLCSHAGHITHAMQQHSNAAAQQCTSAFQQAWVKASPQHWIKEVLQSTRFLAQCGLIYCEREKPHWGSVLRGVNQLSKWATNSLSSWSPSACNFATSLH